MSKSRILVWDAPIRVFHWALALSFVGAFVTADSERLRDVHVVLGYTVFGLIAFRLIWGVVGTRYARFTSFAFGPRAVVAYLGSLLTLRPQHFLGHNPAGSIAIYALLALGLLTGLTGYAHYNELGGEWLEDLHEGLANAMLAVVFVHIAGVIVSSLLHRENLARAMVTGYKTGDPAGAIRGARWIVAALVVASIAALWTGVIPVTDTAPGASAMAASRPARHAEHDRRR
ncbi:MAG TPA: cytochrome b/b6 domain-containing protein [Burkholderiales bacterium]|nr:cytochrome b/b6 domain-containing protein [Burkholderiales bacterium]